METVIRLFVAAMQKLWSTALSIRSSITQISTQLEPLGDGTYGLTINFHPGDNDSEFSALKISGCDIAPAKPCLTKPNDPDCVIFQLMTIKACGEFVSDKLPISLVVPGKFSNQEIPTVFVVIKPRNKTRQLKIKVFGGLFNTITCVRILPTTNP